MSDEVAPARQLHGIDMETVMQKTESETFCGSVAPAEEGCSESLGGTGKAQDSPNFTRNSLRAGKASSASMNPEVEAFVDKQAPSA
ncbi:MAG TPA: hypothetical protein VMS96_03210 [Terriglobales bacterium]|nr:hypothetical protein [Terriglobales bacterium]